MTTTTSPIERMSTPFAAEMVTDHSIRVWTASANLEDERTRRLLRWLSHRSEVTRTVPRPRTGSLVISYDEPDSRAGDFARALRDKLYVLSMPRRAPPMRIRLSHDLPGRARLRVDHPRTATDVRRLAAFISQQPGVTRVVPSEVTGSILFLFDVTRTHAKEVLAAASASTTAEWPPVPTMPPPSREVSKTVLNTAVLGLAASGALSPSVISLAVAATAIPPARRALTALREKRLSVDALDVAAIAISIGTQQPVTAAVITWLLGIGDLVLERASDHARDVMSKLAGIEVIDAWLVRDDDRLVRTRAKKLRRGDRIRVNAGDRIPADGVVVSGAASVDEKALTGESMPRMRRPGARVLAASIVHAGQIDVDVTRASRDTAAANIIRVLQGAGAKPMTLQREAERHADKVVLPTIALAIGAGILAGDLGRTTSVLITDFGSGIRIATPTAALGAMAAAAREGVLVKGGQYLERLEKVDVIVFDKTGTLTKGTPRIVDVVATGPLGEDATLALAAAAEARQTHPNAVAVRELARETRKVIDLDTEIHSSEYVPGAGVIACVSGHSVLVGSRRLMETHDVNLKSVDHIVDNQRRMGASSVLVAVDGRVELVMAYADVVRDEAHLVLDMLRESGRREIVLMSGDSSGTVDSIGHKLGIDRRTSRMLPEDKAREVRAMQSAGHIVAMVGDGINDAPALAVADVGISIRGGTDVALETADVILVDGALSSLPRAFELADKGMTTVRRSLGLVIAPNAAAILLGALGWIGPGVATIINNGSTIVAALFGAMGSKIRSGGGGGGPRRLVGA